MATAVAKKPAKELSATFTEFVDSRGSAITVDREKGLISGVRILGTSSRNKRQYPAAVIAEAISLYEGCAVHISHPSGNPKATRPYQDRIGKLEGVKQEADGGLRGNIRYNPKHVMAEQVAWDCENATDGVGLSPVANCYYRVVNGVEVVNKIEKVYGVDVVCQPATNKNFKESTEIGDEDMSLESLTLEQLKADRADLIRAVLSEQTQSEEAKTREAEIKVMREQLESYKSKDALDAKLAIVEKVVAESKIPTAAVTDGFRAILMEAKDEAAIKVLVEQLKGFVGGGKTFTKPTSTDTATGATGKLSYFK